MSSQLPHMRRVEGDEYYCPRCDKRWGIDEDTPGPCIVESVKPYRPKATTEDDVPVAFMRELDNSYHVCAKGDPDAFPVYRRP